MSASESNSPPGCLCVRTSHFKCFTDARRISDSGWWQLLARAPEDSPSLQGRLKQFTLDVWVSLSVGYVSRLLFSSLVGWLGDSARTACPGVAASRPNREKASFLVISCLPLRLAELLIRRKKQEEQGGDDVCVTAVASPGDWPTL